MHDSDVDVVNKSVVISLNQAREKMRELMALFESRIDFRRQNQAHREHWVEQLAMLTLYKEPMTRNGFG